MGATDQFAARVELRNGIARVALSGELDIDTVPVLTDQLADFERGRVTGVMVDLRDLTFIDSSGLRAFLQARMYAQSNGHRFLLIGAGPQARRLFELTGTEFLLDEDEAVSLIDRFARNGGGAESAQVDGELGA